MEQGDRGPGRVGLLALDLRQREPHGATFPFQVIEADRCEFIPSRRAGKAHQQHDPGPAGRQDSPGLAPAVDADGNGGDDPLAGNLAIAGITAVDALEGFRDADVVGRHRETDGAMQAADLCAV